MKPTTLTATMMVVTVVDLVQSQNTARNANALVAKMAMGLLVPQLVMDIAKMKPTTLTATMMVVTVVDLVYSQNNAQSANAQVMLMEMIIIC